MADAFSPYASQAGGEDGILSPSTVMDSFFEESVDTLKGSIASLKLRVNAAEAATREAEAERLRLVNQVAALEADRRKLGQEAERWRRRCLELEQECATLVVREDSAQGQLRESHSRERVLAVKAIKCRIVAAEAENETMQAKSEARAFNWDAQRVSRELVARVSEVEKLRAELQETRTLAETERAAVERMTTDRNGVAAECKLQREALQDAEKRYGAMEARLHDTEGLLNTAHRKHTDFMEEVQATRLRCQRLEEANNRLRLDLQEAVGQAVRSGEKPFYTMGGPKADESLALFGSSGFQIVSAAKSVPASNPSALSSPKFRADYPGSSHARQLRSKVLSARGEALDGIDRLGRGPPAQA
mmetsp:Transcript_119731/g.211664  ORF Transcript_119731/g.211664 Transcript_119731/m.211664 type:complete len:361 (+) Transcript_119731:55-1137(+)